MDGEKAELLGSSGPVDVDGEKAELLGSSGPVECMAVETLCLTDPRHRAGKGSY